MDTGPKGIDNNLEGLQEEIQYIARNIIWAEVNAVAGSRNKNGSCNNN